VSLAKFIDEFLDKTLQTLWVRYKMSYGFWKAQPRLENVTEDRKACLDLKLTTHARMVGR
jgi:hypothetical protein